MRDNLARCQFERDGAPYVLRVDDRRVAAQLETLARLEKELDEFLRARGKR